MQGLKRSGYGGKSCDNCNVHFEKKRASQRFCSKNCFRVSELPGKQTIFPQRFIGDVNEMRVAIDLMAKGYSVYRSITAHNDCDLIVFIQNKAFRVEVTTASKTKDNKLKFKFHNPLNYDVLALVLHDGSIIYRGDFQ